VREAYEKVAPFELTRAIAGTITIPTEVADLSAEEIDPLMQPRAQKVLKQLAELCAELPETSVARQFGNPVFKAGKKSFACIHRYDQRLCLQVWVGIDQQGFLTMGDRYTIPPYVGHNGWIDLGIEEEINWQEVRELVLNSYRHFALKRMLKQLA
jgi:predicted DNA-binding protein (MmcQ/YjbR family)